MLQICCKLSIILFILSQSVGTLPIVTIKPMATPDIPNLTIDSKRPMKSTITTMGYSHENVTKLDNTVWMSHLSDKTKLTALSMPGTHESLALYGGDLPQCQSLSLQTQLRAGIRVFDIRCRHKENRFRIQHEFYDQKVDFNQVLAVMVEFLIQNPTEVLLVRVREEFKPNVNNQTFEETFKEYIRHESINSFVWEPNTLSPTLGEVRGKIVILQDFQSRKVFGLDYNLFDIQDDSELQSIYGLYHKWEQIKKQLIKADQQREDRFYFNYLSGTTGYLGQLPLFVLPFFVAGGRSDHRTNSPLLLTGRTTLINKDLYPDFPRVYCLGSFCLIAFEGTNDLTLKYISNEKPQFVGIVMSDFPGDGLIESIISLNRFSFSLNDKQHNYPTDETQLLSQHSIGPVNEGPEASPSLQSSNVINQNQYEFSSNAKQMVFPELREGLQSNPNSNPFPNIKTNININSKLNSKNNETLVDENLDTNPLIISNIDEYKESVSDNSFDTTKGYQNSDFEQIYDLYSTKLEKPLNINTTEVTEYSTNFNQNQEMNSFENQNQNIEKLF